MIRKINLKKGNSLDKILLKVKVGDVIRWNQSDDFKVLFVNPVIIECIHHRSTVNIGDTFQWNGSMWARTSLPEDKSDLKIDSLMRRIGYL